MALIERQTLKRARAFLSQLVEGVLSPKASSVPAGDSAMGHSPAPVSPPRSEQLEDPAFFGVAGTRVEDGVVLSWRTTSEQLESARAVALGTRSLRLVLVRVSEADVEVDTLDLGEVAAEGARLLPKVPGLLRAVASVGLFDGVQFTSMAHANVA